MRLATKTEQLDSVQDARSVHPGGRAFSEKKSHDFKFKSRVMSEGLCGNPTEAEIAAKRQVHSHQVWQWKKRSSWMALPRFSDPRGREADVNFTTAGGFIAFATSSFRRSPVIGERQDPATQVKSYRLRLLVIGSPHKAPSLPDEQGFFPAYSLSVITIL